ncbi:MAG TPA: AAA-like domain-containing protein [Woeseiaceae bacterium]
MSEDSPQIQEAEDRRKLDATGEFFSVGVPLHAVRAGYVRRKADDLLYEAAMAGRFAHVLAPERSGKSSLVAATAARLENNGCKVAILDLEQIGDRDGTDAGRWYYDVVYRLMRQLRIRYDLQSWWQDKSILSNRQRLLDFYTEIILEFIPERIVIFLDGIQCIEDLPFADQLLASIRAAHNSRTTNPDFSRIVFVLLGECDPVSLISEPELSPFNVTKAIPLEDFTREQLDLFATELNLDAARARIALDRIYHWTRGQPYLSQKLARAVAREELEGDVEEFIDRVATQQLGGRSALHNEPHMSHIHRVIVNDEKRREPLLNLYGRIRKGVEVSADLGCPLQRRLMAVGLVEIDNERILRVRNRLYAAVFTARWANENLPIRLRVPAMVAGVIFLFLLVPFWYTQWLPGPYLDLLIAEETDLPTAVSAWENFRSFPGHAETADSLFRSYVEQQSHIIDDESDIEAIALAAADIPDADTLPDSLRATFWDRKAMTAMRAERRDAALLASIRALVLPTTRRRQVAASLIGEDYPLLIASLPPLPGGTTVFDPGAMLLTSAEGSRISQWSLASQAVQRRDDWTVTALEVTPLVRRVIIDRKGVISRIGLTLNISHARLTDLRIKIIAPSGRAVEIETGLERASSNIDIRIPAAQLQDLVGESMEGTWSISVRDESLGVAGQLVGWNLKLNSQGALEDFQRGLNIPDPIERETDNLWFDVGGRYAVARAMQSDSARIWDLAFAEPVRAIAVNESEQLIGLDAGARHLVTATQDSINVWDTATGDRVITIGAGAGSQGAKLTDAGRQVFIERRSDVETQLELWSIESGAKTAGITVAGVPSLVAIDASGKRVAVADYDRAVRIWEFASGELVAQLDLPVQPSAISLAAGGETAGAVYGNQGVSLWRIARPSTPLLQELGDGNWQVVFSPTGAHALAGRPEVGFQLYASHDGRLIGPALGPRAPTGRADLLAFSLDEQLVLTGSPAEQVRVWKAPQAAVRDEIETEGTHPLWDPSADHVTLVLPNSSGIAIGDPAGDLHILPIGAGLAEVREATEDVSFLGHNAEIRLLSADSAGSLVASVAADNSVRTWDTSTGQPLPWIADVRGQVITRVAFASDASRLALLQSTRARIIDVGSGAIIASFELGEPHLGIAFAARDRLYLGAENGALRLISEDANGNWSLQQLWQGTDPIRWLEPSPRGEHLVLVDASHRASLFMLSESRIGEAAIQLPGRVEDVAFSRTGFRVLFRTARWVHRASSSATGLIALDSAFGPKPLHGGRIVFGVPNSDTASHTFLPAARNGFVGLVELAFPGSAGQGLFGEHAALLADWEARLGGTSE